MFVHAPGTDICSNAGEGTAVHLSAPGAVRHDVAHRVARVVLQISDGSLSLAPLASFDRWRGRSTAGPFH